MKIRLSHWIYNFNTFLFCIYHLQISLTSAPLQENLQPTIHYQPSITNRYIIKKTQHTTILPSSMIDYATSFDLNYQTMHIVFKF
jgi:hypothetical protein